ncbi:MAG: formyltransferase family protein [Patescibacteria group bacterium]
MPKPKLIIFASGTKEGGGSGFENLVLRSRGENPDLVADIVAVVSNHEQGGVRKRADKLGVRFLHFKPSGDGPLAQAAAYQRLLRETGAEWTALSGWLKLVKGLDPKRTINIHPALLSQLGGRFGGPGMYGHHVHEALKKALDNNEVTESGFTMHFVTDEYDKGPAFAEVRVLIRAGMSADEIGKVVNTAEHQWQPKLTHMVIHKEIAWDGHNASSLTLPAFYKCTPLQ